MEDKKTMENKKVVYNFLGTIFKSLISFLFISVIVWELSLSIITPIKITDNSREIKIRKSISLLAPEISKRETDEIVKSIMMSSMCTNIQEEIIISIAFHESRFNKNAISSKGYKGYMQATTHDIHEFAIVDIMRGSKKLENWLIYRNGNLRYALASYNGGTYPPQISYKYADDVITLAKKLEKIEV